MAVTPSRKNWNKAEVNVHPSKARDIHVEATSTDIRRADALADKLDRQVLSEKQGKITDHHSGERAPTPATDEA